jgi:hypothetical protein
MVHNFYGERLVDVYDKERVKVESEVVAEESRTMNARVTSFDLLNIVLYLIRCGPCNDYVVGINTH